MSSGTSLSTREPGKQEGRKQERPHYSFPRARDNILLRKFVSGCDPFLHTRAKTEERKCAPLSIRIFIRSSEEGRRKILRKKSHEVEGEQVS